MWGHLPLAGERSGAYDPPATQRTAAGLNSNANTVSAHDAHRDPDQHPMRTDGQIPRDGQQQ